MLLILFFRLLIYYLNLIISISGLAECFKSVEEINKIGIEYSWVLGGLNHLTIGGRGWGVVWWA